jgi:hypothetical protein
VDLAEVRMWLYRVCVLLFGVCVCGLWFVVVLCLWFVVVFVVCGLIDVTFDCVCCFCFKIFMC